MQGNAANKAHRFVIGRTLRGKATFKALQDCLKLHLPTPFSTVTLLTRGYFEILFKDEEGAKATRKFKVVEWSDMNLSFSKYIANFRSNIQGAEALLTHTIKVQFPNLHDQFRNTKALTIMANNIGEVLEIETSDSYIKRLAGPTITVEVKDINKLTIIIKILSMAEGASTKDTTTQTILYSDLLNQCRRFDHLARSYKLKRPPNQGGNIPHNNPPS
jgi:hypothetical protein